MIIVVGQVGGPMVAGIFADATGNYRAGFTILRCSPAWVLFLPSCKRPPRPPLWRDNFRMKNFFMCCPPPAGRVQHHRPEGGIGRVDYARSPRTGRGDPQLHEPAPHQPEGSGARVPGEPQKLYQSQTPMPTSIGLGRVRVGEGQGQDGKDDLYPMTFVFRDDKITR